MRLVCLLAVLWGCSGESEAPSPVTEPVEIKQQTAPDGAKKAIEGTAETQVTDRKPSTCSTMLWMNDPDPKGLNVRAEASSKAKVLGVLPQGTEFTAVAALDGWIQYEKPIAFDPEKGLEWVPLPEGPKTGWVFGGLVTTSLRNRWADGEETGHFAIYPKPDLSSTPLARWENSDPKDPANDNGTVEKILDCDGGWLKMQILDVDKKRHVGWVHKDNQCPNQVTTCP